MRGLGFYRVYVRYIQISMGYRELGFGVPKVWAAAPCWVSLQQGMSYLGVYIAASHSCELPFAYV